MMEEEEKYPQSEYCAVIVGEAATLKKTAAPRKLFETYIQMPFENHQMSVVAEYNTLLTNIYGDYMGAPHRRFRKSVPCQKSCAEAIKNINVILWGDVFYLGDGDFISLL